MEISRRIPVLPNGKPGKTLVSLVAALVHIQNMFLLNTSCADYA